MSFKSSHTAIAPLRVSSRPDEPFLRRPRAPFERGARNLSNENVLELENLRCAFHSCCAHGSRSASARDDQPTLDRGGETGAALAQAAQPMKQPLTNSEIALGTRALSTGAALAVDFDPGAGRCVFASR